MFPIGMREGYAHNGEHAVGGIDRRGRVGSFGRWRRVEGMVTTSGLFPSVLGGGWWTTSAESRVRWIVLQLRSDLGVVLEWCWCQCRGGRWSPACTLFGASRKTRKRGGQHWLGEGATWTRVRFTMPDLLDSRGEKACWAGWLTR